VIIRHDSVYTTLYGHAQSLSVEKGQNVKKGQVIATVGSSGRATGPHCHFEVRINDRPTNPMNYLR
jgi:murein DD-endopeptidase MepM/ murein hydrolase activator NlpD